MRVKQNEAYSRFQNNEIILGDMKNYAKQYYKLWNASSDDRMKKRKSTQKKGRGDNKRKIKLTSLKYLVERADMGFVGCLEETLTAVRF